MTTATRKSQTQSFSFPPALLDRLRAFSEERGVSQSEVVRAAIERHLFEEAEVEEIEDSGLRISAKLDPDPYVRSRNLLAVEFPDRYPDVRPPQPKRPAVLRLHGYIGIDLGERPWSEEMYDRFVDWLPREVAKLWAYERERVSALGIEPNGSAPRFGGGMADPRQGR